MHEIERACNYILTKAQPKSTGMCAAAVRSAVDFGFGKHIDRAVSAKDYGPSYEKIGFKKIFSFPEIKKEDYKEELGDICIFQPVKVIKEGKEIIEHPNGHICMLTSKGWVSDFVQRDRPGGKIRDKNPAFDIYRYGG